MAGRGFSIEAGQSQAASGTETNIELTVSATTLVRITRLAVSQSTHKTSEQYDVRGQRVTTTGTGTAYTEIAKEPFNTSGVTVKINMSVEPTYTASTVYPNRSWNSLTGRDIVFPPGQELYVAPAALWATYIVTPSGTTTFTPHHELEGEELG
jgi:hypothetical protein